MYMQCNYILLKKLFVVLEVYQFARDAAVADNWLASHEPTVKSKDLGVSY